MECREDLVRARRGYILLESAVAGGILAVALSTSVAIVAHYRRETTLAARIQEASAIAIAKADAVVGAGLSNASPPADQALTAVDADPHLSGASAQERHPGFRVGYTSVPAGLETDSTPNLLSATSLIELIVTVEYPSTDGPRTVEFRRLKRDRL